MYSSEIMYNRNDYTSTGVHFCVLLDISMVGYTGAVRDNRVVKYTCVLYTNSVASY